MALATHTIESRLTSRPQAAISDWRAALPEMTAGKVTLRELRPSDAPVLHELLTTEKVARFISPPPASIEVFEQFIAWTHREREAGRYLCFAVVPRGGDTAIGILQLRAADSSFGTAEWGFAIGSAFWGSGVFMDAAKLLIEFAFETVGVARLEARVAQSNGRGHGALAKVGAVREAILRRSFLCRGEYLDQVLWSIVRQDWRQSKAVWGSTVVH